MISSFLRNNKVTVDNTAYISKERVSFTLSDRNEWFHYIWDSYNKAETHLFLSASQLLFLSPRRQNHVTGANSHDWTGSEIHHSPPPPPIFTYCGWQTYDTTNRYRFRVKKSLLRWMTAENCCVVSHYIICDKSRVALKCHKHERDCLFNTKPPSRSVSTPPTEPPAVGKPFSSAFPRNWIKTNKQKWQPRSLPCADTHVRCHELEAVYR